MRQNHTLLLYALVKGYELNVGKIVKESILDYEQGKFSGNIPHPYLITLLCIKGGVKFNEVKEERCPKVSPLTLVGVCKAPVESKEGERRDKTRKRKMVGIEKEPKEPAPIAIPEEEAKNEEMGDFEAYAEQPMLSLLQTKANQLKLELKKGENI